VRAANAGWPAADAVATFLFFVLVAVVLGLVGAVAHGLGYLLAVGVGVLVVDLVYLGFHLRGGRRRPTR
jgi:hypothetical protein